MADQRAIAFEDRTVVVKTMDDRYTVSDCPQEPTHYEVLQRRNSTRCAGMGVSGTPIREVTADARKRYGNCAVLAWDGDIVVGISTFFPVEDLSERKAYGWDMMEAYLGTGTLAVASCVLCSLSGHQYRGKGIGRAMAKQMIEWAKQRAYRQIGVFEVTSGLTTSHWEDACRPPMPFWQRLGFSVVGVRER